MSRESLKGEFSLKLKVQASKQKLHEILACQVAITTCKMSMCAVLVESSYNSTLGGI